MENHSSLTPEVNPRIRQIPFLVPFVSYDLLRERES
jgi:hypothetical protein